MFWILPTSSRKAKMMHTTVGSLQTGRFCVAVSLVVIPPPPPTTAIDHVLSTFFHPRSTFLPSVSVFPSFPLSLHIHIGVFPKWFPKPFYISFVPHHLLDENQRVFFVSRFSPAYRGMWACFVQNKNPILFQTLRSTKLELEYLKWGKGDVGRG